MNCPNCGAQNINGSTFCVKCGTPLNTNSAQNNQTVSSQPVNEQMNQNINEQVNNTYSNSNNQKSKIAFSQYFSIILEVILKPFTALKNEINKFDDFQNSFILTSVIVVISLIISLIRTVINTVRVTTGGIFSEEQTKWVWDNLEEVDFIKVIGTNLLFFFGIILGIALVYYIAGLITKKQINFSRLLGVSAISLVPVLICALIISPILSMIYAPLGFIIIIVGFLYTLLIIYEGMNGELLLVENTKYYVNLISLSIILISIYYLYIKIFIGEMASDILFSLF